MIGCFRSWPPILSLLTRGDRWLLLILLLASLATLYQLVPTQPSGHTARIIHKGQILLELNLNKDQRVTVGGDRGPVVLQVKNGAIQIIESECQTRFCIKNGAINNVNQIIVCVPNRIVIKILGDPGLDVITG